MRYCPPRPRRCRRVGAAAPSGPLSAGHLWRGPRGQWGTGLVPRVPKLRNSGRNQEPGIRFRFRASQIPVPGSCRNTDSDYTRARVTDGPFRSLVLVEWPSHRGSNHWGSSAALAVTSDRGLFGAMWDSGHSGHSQGQRGRAAPSWPRGPGRALAPTC